jgi:hypothetical protein
MDRKWLGLLTIPLALGLILASPFLIGFFAPSSDGGVNGEELASFMKEKESDILAVRILRYCVSEILCGTLFCGDLVYLDLRDALFIPQNTGAWNASAIFVNATLESNGELFYEKTFEITVNEVETIHSAIYASLSNTIPSSDSVLDLMFFIGFGLDILYSDGTWIQLFTIPSAKGHVMFLNGTYTGNLDSVNPFDLNFLHRDENRLNGVLLEPGTALDELVATMNAVFVNHLG